MYYRAPGSSLSFVQACDTRKVSCWCGVEFFHLIAKLPCHDKSYSSGRTAGGPLILNWERTERHGATLSLLTLLPNFLEDVVISQQ